MKKNIIISIVALIAIAAIVNTFFGWFNPSENDRIAAETLNPKNETITFDHYITKDSTIYIKYTPNLGELPQNNVTKKYYSYVSDTLAPALKIAKDKINELQQVRANLEGTVKSQRQEIDKEKNRTVYYKDKYFSAVSKTDTAGNSTLDYKYNAQIDIISEMKRKNIFAKEIQEISISSPDKNLKINGVEHFKKNTQVKPKKIGLGIQAGYYYAPATNQFYPGLGVGISYNLIRL